MATPPSFLQSIVQKWSLKCDFDFDFLINLSHFPNIFLNLATSNQFWPDLGIKMSSLVYFAEDKTYDVLKISTLQRDGSRELIVGDSVQKAFGKGSKKKMWTGQVYAIDGKNSKNSF